MSSGDQLAVVIAPATAEEAGRLFSTLLSGGFHPTMDYAGDDHGAPLANFPILVPQAELAEAKGYLRGIKANPPAQQQSLKAMFGLDPSLSDRPVGPLPPENIKTMSANMLKAVGVVAVLVVAVVVITGLVWGLQFLTTLGGHAQHP